MADQLAELKMKYQSVLNLMQAQNVQLNNLNMEGNKLLIRGAAPSASAKDAVWNQIKLVDANYANDLIADIQAPAASAAAAGGAPVEATRKYTVVAGDSLSKISKHFYGDANQYMKIFEANKDQLADPDKIKPGMDLIVP
jgi:nucleoid-associated protein YgaU